MSLVSYISSLATRVATEIKSIKLDLLKVAFHDNQALKGYLNSANYDIVGGVITPKTMTATTKGLVPTPPNNTTTFLRGDGTFAEPPTGGGTATGEIWTALTGAAYASATTITFPGLAKHAKLILDSLFTCTDSAGTTRRYGYVSAASYAAGTITATVVCTSDLAATDIDFKVAYNQKSKMYWHVISIPGEIMYDASYSQGPWFKQIPWNYVILPPDYFVITAATGAAASMTIQLYKNTTTLYSSAPDMVTYTARLAQRLTIFTGSAGETLSLRIPASAGTTKAADFQARIPVIPIDLFTAF